MKRPFITSGQHTGKKLRVTKKKTFFRPSTLAIREHNFVRHVSTSSLYRLGLDLFTGWTINGTATNLYDMQVSFSLTGVNVSFGGVANFAINMPSYGEFVNLYDQYRIDYVEAVCMFSNNSSSVNSASTVLPIMYCAKDYDDTNSAPVTSLQQYDNCQVWQVGERTNSDGKRIVRIRPNTDMQVYNGATSGYARNKPMFIDTGSAAVPHYGLKFAFDPITAPSSTTVVGYLAIDFIFHMTMKNTK